MIAAIAAITSLAVLVLVLFVVGEGLCLLRSDCQYAIRVYAFSSKACTLPGVVTGHFLSKYRHKLPCCMTVRGSELDEVLVVNKAVAEQTQTKAAAGGRQRIAISASTTQSLESSAGVLYALLV